MNISQHHHLDVLKTYYENERWICRMILKLLSSKSNARSTAAGHVGQNSSAHVARSVAAIWTLIPL